MKAQAKTLAEICNKSEKFIEEMSVLLGGMGMEPESIERDFGILSPIRNLKAMVGRIDAIGKILGGDKWRQPSDATVIDISSPPKKLRRLEIDLEEAPKISIKSE